ncbi:hypothetical protein EGI16_13255 [Chryseobacterium sp. G0240]|nr:hypothetical protein EGI16_13255 [Chryseobacterium sp. G0240]
MLIQLITKYLNGLNIGIPDKKLFIFATAMKHLNSILRLPFFSEYYSPIYRSGRFSIAVI